MTATADSPLDLSRLERVRESGGKITARCPACAETGGDRSGRHLAILPNGRFACAAFSGDAEHRRRIFELVGIRSDQPRDPWRDREWRDRREREARRERARRAIADSVAAKRAVIFDQFAWTVADAWEDSPIRLEGPDADDPAEFIAALFPDDALLWTGEVFQSGPRHADRWRTVAEWSFASEGEIGPMVTPCTWKSATVNRTREHVERAPYVVLDFDGVPGWSPRNASELKTHLSEALAVTRWLREGLGWRLASVLFTGSKSIHAWFHDPGKAALESLKAAAPALGIDAGLLGHPEHPARLPGQRHSKTGNLSRLLFLECKPIN